MRTNRRRASKTAPMSEEGDWGNAAGGPGGSEPPRRLSGHRCGARCAARPASATRGVRRTTREARARDRCGGRADDAGELAIPEHRVARDQKPPRGAIGRGLLLYRQRFPPSRNLGASRHELGADAVDQAKVIRKPRLLSDNASSYISGEPVDWLEEHLSSRIRFIPAASPRVWAQFYIILSGAGFICGVSSCPSVWRLVVAHAGVWASALRCWLSLCFIDPLPGPCRGWHICPAAITPATEIPEPGICRALKGMPCHIAQWVREFLPEAGANWSPWQVPRSSRHMLSFPGRRVPRVITTASRRHPAWKNSGRNGLQPPASSVALFDASPVSRRQSLVERRTSTSPPGSF